MRLSPISGSSGDSSKSRPLRCAACSGAPASGGSSSRSSARSSGSTQTSSPSRSTRSTTAARRPSAWSCSRGWAPQRFRRRSWRASPTGTSSGVSCSQPTWSGSGRSRYRRCRSGGPPSGRLRARDPHVDRLHRLPAGRGVADPAPRRDARRADRRERHLEHVRQHRRLRRPGGRRAAVRARRPLARLRRRLRHVSLERLVRRAHPEGRAAARRADARARGARAGSPPASAPFAQSRACGS